MHLFHHTDLGSRTIALSEEEAHHALSVLRLKPGATIGLLDGRGTRATGTLVQLDRKHNLVEIVARETLPPERLARIHIAVAPTKQMERLEWFVEKAVEVGVDRITPVFTSRTERSRLRTDRLLRVMVAAMKQSRRSWLPELDEPMELQEFLAADLPRQRYFGWCEGEHRSLMQCYTTDAEATVLIGPEGDLTPEEAVRLQERSFQAVSLGAARLRTETAALTACTWMSLLQQR
jgi:16S rRNA (uracil1498-N3)-methyltransferase